MYERLTESVLNMHIWESNGGMQILKVQYWFHKGLINVDSENLRQLKMFTRSKCNTFVTTQIYIVQSQGYCAHQA